MSTCPVAIVTPRLVVQQSVFRDHDCLSYVPEVSYTSFKLMLLFWIKTKKFTLFLIKLGSLITLLINVFIYTVLLVVYRVTDAESCMSQNITDWTGTFQSPNYPLNYTPNMDCFWLLRVSEGNQIEINFQNFSVRINNII